MKKVELSGIDWYRKLVEKLTFALREIDDGITPQDHHWDIMEKVYPLMEDGDIIFYKSKQKPIATKTEQTGLFDNSDKEKK